MKIFLYAHGGSSNHGCEAIVRTTAGIFADAQTTVYSFRPDADRKYQIDQICSIYPSEQVKPSRTSPQFILGYLDMLLRKKWDRLDLLQSLTVLEKAAPGSIAFSIGGDNYCGGGAYFCGAYRAHLEKSGVKTVLWGCSVEPDMIDDKIRNDLMRYNLIVARESITYDALRSINANTILTPDPAFTLERMPGIYPEGLQEKPYIGINVSPMVQGNESSEGITFDNYRVLIQNILNQTDRNIALIPHVVWAHNDDRIPLKQLYEEFQDTGRVYMVEDQNCMQLKDIISGCEFFIGARTHSTIAAYSTCVPTLVVGYSVKAKGIARDLFGTEEGYVLPVQSLRQKDDLTNAFKSLYARHGEIRKHLTDMMPGYIQGINAAREAVEKL